MKASTGMPSTLVAAGIDAQPAAASASTQRAAPRAHAECGGVRRWSSAQAISSLTRSRIAALAMGSLTCHRALTRAVVDRDRVALRVARVRRRRRRGDVEEACAVDQLAQSRDMRRRQPCGVDRHRLRQSREVCDPAFDTEFDLHARVTATPPATMPRRPPCAPWRRTGGRRWRSCGRRTARTWRWAAMPCRAASRTRCDRPSPMHCRRSRSPRDRTRGWECPSWCARRRCRTIVSQVARPSSPAGRPCRAPGRRTRCRAPSASATRRPGPWR